MDDILSVERPFDRRTPCIGLGVGGGGPRGLWMFPGPDILLLLPPFDLSKPAEVDLRDGGSPAGKTSFAPGAAMWNVERSLTWTGAPDLYCRIKNTVFTPRQDEVFPSNLALKYVRSSEIREQSVKMDRAKPDHSEPEHAEPNQGRHRQFVMRDLCCCGILHSTEW